MTVLELYEWAKDNDVANCNIAVRDSCGNYTNKIEPEIVENDLCFEVDIKSML